MTTTFAILLAIAISASLVFALLHSRRRQNKTEKLIHSFNKAAAAFNLSIARQEQLGNRVIGFDAEKNSVLFLEASDNKHDGYLSDLDEIQSCTVKHMYSPLYASQTVQGAEAYVNTIALQLDYTQKAEPAQLLFYNKANDPLVEMRQRAEQAKQWQAFLSTRLRGKCNKVEIHKRSTKQTYIAKIEKAASIRRVKENAII